MQIIIKPIITEQSMKNTKNSVFTFEVARYSRKPNIREAVERLYSVHVKKVATHVVIGKEKRIGKKRMTIKRPDRKIARVWLTIGEKIQAFEIASV